MKIPPPRFPYGTIHSAAGARTTEHPLLSADPQSAGTGLVEILGLAAGTEALFRAFLAEHDRDRLPPGSGCGFIATSSRQNAEKAARRANLSYELRMLERA